MLQKCGEIEELLINANRIGDEGATALASAMQGGDPVRLHLVETAEGKAEDDKRITVMFFTDGSCPALRRIDISGNSISEDGVATLATSLSACLSCPALEALNISRNDFDIGNTKAKSTKAIKALAEAKPELLLTIDDLNG